MKATKTLAALALISLVLVSCKPTQKVTEEHQQTTVEQQFKQREPLGYIPQARIYTMSGAYQDYVPVTLNAEANGLVSYPAPSDIRPSQEPIELCCGWWLDRRGVAPNTVFTSYTYQDYMKLPSAPSQEKLMESIMPGAYVTAIVELPMKTQQAVADTAAVNKLIRSNLPDCKVVWTTPPPRFRQM